jgi:hypothetical protein
MGAAYGTFRSGAAVAAVGVERPDLVMKVWLHFAAASQMPQSTTDTMPVTAPNGHGGYHLRLCARGISAHSRGHEPSAKAELLFVQVRKLSTVGN